MTCALFLVEPTVGGIYPLLTEKQDESVIGHYHEHIHHGTEIQHSNKTCMLNQFCFEMTADTEHYLPGCQSRMLCAALQACTRGK
jgi:hypothetical protein